jgi:hypothetical protein
LNFGLQGISLAQRKAKPHQQWRSCTNVEMMTSILSNTENMIGVDDGKKVQDSITMGV